MIDVAAPARLLRRPKSEREKERERLAFGGGGGGAVGVFATDEKSLTRADRQRALASVAEGSNAARAGSFRA